MNRGNGTPPRGPRPQEKGYFGPDYGVARATLPNRYICCELCARRSNDEATKFSSLNQKPRKGGF